MTRYRPSKSRYGNYPPYVPVAERKAKGQKAMDLLRKKSSEIHPVVIEGRVIAKSFWGKNWCDHLESFGDFESRLPRGRTYVRNGSVCHLAIDKGCVSAKVSGSSIYTVTINIQPLEPSRWENLKTACVGKIDSLIALLQGKFSHEVMALVIDTQTGLMPNRKEISYTCSCPDWASMCKHVAAVIYGIGARLDHQPELLFLLRGVDHNELIETNIVNAVLTGTTSPRRSRRQSAIDLQTLFDVDIDTKRNTTHIETDSNTQPQMTNASDRATVATNKKNEANPKMVKTKISKPFNATARAIAGLRKKLGLSQTDFAKACQVTPATIARWESSQAALKLNAKSLLCLQSLRDGNIK